MNLLSNNLRLFKVYEKFPTPRRSDVDALVNDISSPISYSVTNIAHFVFIRLKRDIKAMMPLVETNEMHWLRQGGVYSLKFKYIYSMIWCRYAFKITAYARQIWDS